MKKWALVSDSFLLTRGLIYILEKREGLWVFRYYWLWDNQCWEETNIEPVESQNLKTRWSTVKLLDEKEVLAELL